MKKSSAPCSNKVIISAQKGSAMKPHIAVFFLTLLAFATLFHSQIAVAQADTIPSFGSCPAPGGTMSYRSTYDFGPLVGSPLTHIGARAIYSAGSNGYTQCYCPADNTNAGVQTNYVAAAGLTDEQKAQLTTNGYVLVDGSTYNLGNGQFYAKNASYTCSYVEFCNQIGLPTPTPTVAPTATPTAVPTATPTPTNPPIGGGQTPSGPGAPGPCTDTAPTMATSLSMKRLNATTVELSWNAVNGANNYSILYGLKSGQYIYGVARTGNVTTYRVEALQPNETYYFVVQAVNGCAQGPNSNEVGGAPVLGITTLAPTGTATTNALAIVLLGLGTTCIGYGVAHRFQKR